MHCHILCLKIHKIYEFYKTDKILISREKELLIFTPILYKYIAKYVYVVTNNCRDIYLFVYL